MCGDTSKEAGKHAAEQQARHANTQHVTKGLHFQGFNTRLAWMMCGDTSKTLGNT